MEFKYSTETTILSHGTTCKKGIQKIVRIYRKQEIRTKYNEVNKNIMKLELDKKIMGKVNIGIEHKIAIHIRPFQFNNNEVHLIQMD